MKIFQPQIIQVTTGLLAMGTSNAVLEDFSVSELGYLTQSFYDAEGDELLTQEEITSDAVFSIIDWMPDYNYLFAGLSVQQAAMPSNPVNIYLILDPNGINHPVFTGSLNLKLMGTTNTSFSSIKEPTILAYQSPTPEANKLRFIIKHDVGVQHVLALVLFIERIT